MKTLLYQNNIEITKKQNYEVFYCSNCGAVFESDEYENFDNFKRDTCITCKSFCIINKEKLKEKGSLNED